MILLILSILEMVSKLESCQKVLALLLCSLWWCCMQLVLSHPPAHCHGHNLNQAGNEWHKHLVEMVNWLPIWTFHLPFR